MAVPSSFGALGVSELLIRALDAMAIRLPTEVQMACIPPILQGRDCIGTALTGSGKTVAFAVPILQALAADPHGFFAVVLTPTRELAFQIHEQFAALGSAMNLKSVVVVGGMDQMAQAVDLGQRPHIVVATPGRLADLLQANQGEWSLSRVRFLVLDEADRLLAPSFAAELGAILKDMPASRQTLLFTATVTPAILALERKEPTKGKERPFLHLLDTTTSIPQTLRQLYVFNPSQVRDCYLFYLLSKLCTLTGASPLPRKKGRNESDDIDALPQAILFVGRCRTAAHLSNLLTELGVSNVALHSHLTQRERLASLNAFRAQRAPLLVATDVGSRGLDIPAVEVVINYDVPRVADDYVHRVGRTARAGRRGVSVTIVTEGDVELVGMVEERVGRKMEELELPEEEVLQHLHKVTTAQRVALMQLQADRVSERNDRNKAKAAISAGAGLSEKTSKKRRKLA